MFEIVYNTAIVRLYYAILAVKLKPERLHKPITTELQ